MFGDDDDDDDDDVWIFFVFLFLLLLLSFGQAKGLGWDSLNYRIPKPTKYWYQGPYKGHYITSPNKL